MTDAPWLCVRHLVYYLHTSAVRTMFLPASILFMLLVLAPLASTHGQRARRNQSNGLLHPRRLVL
jgi:hypothetical protein